MRVRKWTVNELEVAIKTAESWSQVFRTLSLSISGGSMISVKKIADANNFSYSHFLGRGWTKGKEREAYNKIPLEKILVENSFYATNKLKNRLIKEGLKIHQCERCMLTTWNDIEITLEVDHVNGNNKDHRIDMRWYANWTKHLDFQSSVARLAGSNPVHLTKLKQLKQLQCKEGSSPTHATRYAPIV